MNRLIIEAVSSEYSQDADVKGLWLFVSVSRASDGTPVTGLELDNSSICSPLGPALDMTLEQVGSEAIWERFDEEPAGCYSLSIAYNWGTETGSDSSPVDWVKGEFYPFGIQIRVPDQKAGIVHMGQTVLRIESLES